MSVLEITGEDFEKEVLKSEKTVIIDFFATWCEPCQMQSPIMEEIASTEDSVKVVKIDVDRNAELADKYDIMSIPTIVVMKNGEVIKEFVGITKKEEILASVK
ncbi:MAG: thioredoxin [Clostridia bacterium]|nr:thioredoxin [Clostridia bacterium]